MKKFQAPCNKKNFIKTFKGEISAFLGKEITELSSLDFPGTVKVKHTDESKFLFKNAFYVFQENPQTEGVYAVFTEHVGYHYFYGEEIKKITYTQNPPGITFTSENNVNGQPSDAAYKTSNAKWKKETKNFKPIVIVNNIKQ